MKKHQRRDKRLRADKYRSLRRHMLRRLGSHNRWSEKPEHLARSRAFVSATARNLEHVLEDDAVFEVYCQRLDEAILARKRIR